MLRELAVQNLAVIEDVRVELHAGFCAWTGETGAGKSLLLGALGLLLGDRGSAEWIRAGADELRVTGRFEIVRDEQKSSVGAILNDALMDDEIVISRRLSRAGRSTALVNEQIVSVATLKKLGELLVDVHGQRESYSLLQPGFQLELLDAFGKLTVPRSKYEKAAERVRELRRRHRELSEAQRMRQRELALVRFEQEELDAAGLLPGELTGLQKEREKLIHAQSLATCTAAAASRLYDDDGSVLETIGKLLKELHHWEKFDDQLSAIADRIEQLRPEVQDIAEECRSLSEKYDADPERLDELERRVQFLKKLETKYGRTADDLITYRASLDSKAATWQQDEDDLTRIEAELLPAFHELKISAQSLSSLRAKVARKLAAETQKEIVDLQMVNSRIAVELQTHPLGDDPLTGDVPRTGIDQLEILLAANPGEPARPLRKVASGGELSRAMLALKTVLAAHDPVRTLVVFDEIDANVGGRLGDVLGQKLAELGRTHQVLCVTHLPQVAGYAAAHWSIRKSTSGKRTTTAIVPLDHETDRVEELALMLRGESRSASTRREAAEMLRTGRKSPTGSAARTLD